MKCPFCNKQLSIHGENHIYSCNKELDKKEIKFQFIKYNYSDICDKNLLIDNYINNLKSLPDLKKEFNIPYKSTIFLLNYYNIPVRSIKESNILITNKKCKETCISKYGVDNISKLDFIKNKKKETFIKNYGVDNIWKSKEYYNWLHNYMLEKYGKKSIPNRYGNMNKYYDNLSDENKKNKMIKPLKKYIEYWNNLTDEQKTNLIIRRTQHFTKNGFYSSSLETKISECLDRLNISYTRQFYIGRKIYDIKLLNSDIILEINGDFWHGNPKIYKETDILNHPFNKTTAKNLWIKDEKKRILAEKKGYKIIYIWEKEIKENKNNLMSLILEKLSN